MRQISFLMISLFFSFSLLGQSVEEYQKERSEFIREANSYSFAREIVLTPAEERVDQHLRSLLTMELRRRPIYPERPFLEVKGDIEKTALYQFLHEMPKGMILHAHTPALGDLRWLVNKATYRPDCYMYLGKKEGKLVPGALRFFDKHPGEGWESVEVLRQRSGDALLFDKKIVESFTIGVSDLSQTHVWDKFYDCFYHYHSLLSADPVLYKAFVKDALLQLVEEDHISAIEVRDSPTERLILMFKEVISEIQESHPEFTLKVICYIGRDKEREVAKKLMQEAFRLRKKYPEIVVGFDIAGEEDDQHPNSFFLEELLELNRMADAEGISMPYYFHGGETSRPGDGVDGFYNDNLIDIYLLHAKRVGHACSLIKSPFLMEKFRQANIAIEVCPISNQILQYAADLRNHPALTYLKAGLPVTISPDDPGIFGYRGVTADYYEATVAWQLDLRAIKQLVKNSIHYSSLDEREKEALMKVWQRQWDAFIEDELKKY